MDIREFHLFAGIGGGIYGGSLLGHKCCAAVEVDKACQENLRQKQSERWLNEFPIYSDIRSLSGENFKGQFDVLCGGFPCQAFSHAAHGKNIKEKNLWPEMFRFVKESEAPVVFGENVTEKAIRMATDDLLSIGYKVCYCKLSCDDLGGDHRRIRFWLMAVRDTSSDAFKRIADHISTLPKFQAKSWTKSVKDLTSLNTDLSNSLRIRLKEIGNAQSPLVAATAFRILLNRHLSECNSSNFSSATKEEIERVFFIQPTWIKKTYGIECIVHTPTTMANYCCASMQKHLGCRNYVKVFGNKVRSEDAEYLMGFPLGASLSGWKESESEFYYSNYKNWKTDCIKDNN